MNYENYAGDPTIYAEQLKAPLTDVPQMISLEQFNRNAVEDAREDMHRAHECWKKWHSRFAREWLRECMAEYRMALLIRDLT